MEKETLEMAYKCYCFEQGVFDNDRKNECHMVREYQDGTKQVFEKPNCKHNLQDSEGYKSSHFNGTDRLMECHLGYEYFVSYLLTPNDMIVNENEDREYQEVIKKGYDWRETTLTLKPKTDETNPQAVQS